MKKLFFKILFLVLLSLVFVYLLIDCIEDKDGIMKPVLVLTAVDGLSPIGFVLLIPTFVFTIITLTVKKNNLEFVRCILGIFAAGFVIVSTCLLFVDRGVKSMRIAIPVAIMVFSIGILIIAIADVIDVIKTDKKEKELEKNKEETKNIE